MKRSTENGVTALLAALCLLYVAVRAWILPVTHDEGATILNFVPRRLIENLFFQLEANPDNHLLNTLSVKTLLGIFPGRAFVVRLPSLIGLGLYLWAGVLLCRRLSENASVRLFGVVLLIGNPYLLDFFGLARGYGLAIGLMMMALELGLHYRENNRPRTLRTAILLAGLAVYAHFTELLFFIPLALLLFGAAWRQNRPGLAFWPAVRPALYTLLAFVLLWWAPLSRLNKEREKVQGISLKSHFEALERMVGSSTHHYFYLGAQTAAILTWGVLIALLVGGIMAIRRSRRTVFAGDAFLFMAAVYGGAILANLSSIQVLHTAPLSARVSLLFYPFFALLLTGMAGRLWERRGRRAWIMMAPILLLALINNVRCLNFHDYQEWWFDSGTLEVLRKIRSIQASAGQSEPYTLDCSFAYQNSFITHVQEFSQGYDRVVKLAPWHPRRMPEGDPDFFYLMDNDEVNAVQGRYEMVYAGEVGRLFRKKAQ